MNLLVTFVVNTTEVELAYKDGGIPDEGFRPLNDPLQVRICKRWAVVAVRNVKGINYKVPFELKVRQGNFVIMDVSNPTQVYRIGQRRKM